jgi:hypothetical protein
LCRGFAKVRLRIKQVAHRLHAASAVLATTAGHGNWAWLLHCSEHHPQGETSMNSFVRLLLAAVSVTAAACGASRPPPTDHLATAIAAVHGAQVAGAAQIPKAALQLKLAEEQVEQARRMVKNGDNERADYMTLRAFNDAQLAVALVREQEARTRAENAVKQASGASAAAQP